MVTSDPELHAVTTTVESRPIFRQALFDIEALASSYSGAVPDNVLQTAREYNRSNLRDLACHVNSTEHLLAPDELCNQRAPSDISGSVPPRPFVEQVYDGAEGRQLFKCGSSRTVGDGFSYERMLLDRYYAAVVKNEAVDVVRGVSEMRAALPRLRSTRFERAQGTVWNEGSSRAVDIEVRVPVEFSVVREADKKFSLNPGEERSNIIFETKRGPVSERALDEPAFVSWSVDKNYVDFSWLRTAIVISLILLLVVLVNDFLRHKEESE